MVARKKKSNKIELNAYWHNPDIHILYEIMYNKETITVGTLIKIKHERSVFRFDRLVVNTDTKKEWIDVYDTTLGGWRSFYPDRLAGPFIAKRSRAKKA